MKRVWIFVGAGLLLLLLFAWWYSHREWLTDELLRQVYHGMPKEEVEALLGKPEKCYSPLSVEDYHALWFDYQKPTITLVASENPLLPTLNTSGPPIRRVGGYSLLGPRITDESPATGSNPWEEWTWVGRKRMLILLVDEGRGVTGIRAYSVTKTGGGFYSWLSGKWDEWTRGK